MKNTGHQTAASRCTFIGPHLQRPRDQLDVTMDRTDVSLIALRRILRATDSYGRDLARDAGLTAVQLRVLQIVAEKGKCHPSEVASRMSVSQATISVIIKKLESWGLLARDQSEDDRRQIDLTLTEDGKARLSAAPDALQQRYVKKFEALPEWEQSMIVSVLQRVAGMLDEGEFDASPVLATGEITRHEAAAARRKTANG
jgi:DNA-binding MarR family transcriptional regulator